MTNITLLTGLFQICYITSDLDAGMRQLSDINGIMNFRTKRNVRSVPDMPEMLMHQAHVFIGPTLIELIQPAGGDGRLYRDFCPAGSEAIRFHHYGMWADDAAEYEGFYKVLEEQSIPVVFKSSIPRVGGVIYAYARMIPGHYLEYVHMTPEVKGSYYADVPHTSNENISI